MYDFMRNSFLEGSTQILSSSPSPFFMKFRVSAVYFSVITADLKLRLHGKRCKFAFFFNIYRSPAELKPPPRPKFFHYRIFSCYPVFRQVNGARMVPERRKNLAKCRIVNVSAKVTCNYISISIAQEYMLTTPAMTRQKQFTGLFFILLLCLLPRIVAIRPPLQRQLTNSVNIQNEGHRAVALQPRHKRIRPGPRPKSLYERVYRPRGPIKRIRRSYSRERKLDVLLFLTHHRVAANVAETQYRRPTISEASIYWKIPQSTIPEWWSKQEEI